MLLALFFSSATWTCAFSFPLLASSAPVAQRALTLLPKLSAVKRNSIVDMRLWTFEEAQASGIDAGYIQGLEMRVTQLCQLEYGDHCVLMPIQCIGDQCMMLHEYVAELEDTAMRLDDALRGCPPPQQGNVDFLFSQQGYTYLPSQGMF